jgi:hypothetical protein
MALMRCAHAEYLDDYQSLRLSADLREQMDEHLADCSYCKNRLLEEPAPRDRSKRLATIATAAFGLVGFAVVVAVAFSQPQAPVPAAPRVEAPAPAPLPNAFTVIEPSSTDPSDSGD